MWKSLSLLGPMILAVCLVGGCSKNPADSDPQCEHVLPSGWAIMSGDSVLAWQWEATTGGSIVLHEGADLTALTIELLDEDSLEVSFQEGCVHELRWPVADTGIAEFEPVDGERQKVTIRGTRAGSTTFQLRLWHGDHADYDSAPIPITVISATQHVPLGADAITLNHKCSDLAYWNYDLIEGPGGADGAVVLTQGEVLENVEVRFLDSVLLEHGLRRQVLPDDPGYTLDWTSSNTAVAHIGISDGSPWSVDIEGKSAGATLVTFRLQYAGTTELQSGAIPVIVRDPDDVQDDAPSFRILLNGWRVIVRDGQLMTFDPVCDRNVPALLELETGKLTALYSLRMLDNECRSSTPSLNLYRLAFDFTDPCIARVLAHPIHWGEYFVFHLLGLSEGETALRIHLLRKDNVIEWTSPPIPVVVGA